QDNAVLAPSHRGVQGGVFAAPAPVDEFTTAFAQAFGHKPNGMAIQGHDIGRLLVQVAAERAWSGREVGLLLNRPEGFYGRGGYLRFNALGLTERGMALVQVGDGAFHVMQPALTMVPLPIPADLTP